MTVTCCCQPREPPFTPPSLTWCLCTLHPQKIVLEVERGKAAGGGLVFGLTSCAAAMRGLWQHLLPHSANHSFRVIKKKYRYSSCPLKGRSGASVEAVFQLQGDLLGGVGGGDQAGGTKAKERRGAAVRLHFPSCPWPLNSRFPVWEPRRKKPGFVLPECLLFRACSPHL